MKQKLFSLILTVFILITLPIVGQNNKYPTKTIQGTDYYVYTVQPSEGLLAIGRKFEISANELTKVNPEVKAGLKSGQEILIPINKSKVLQKELSDNSVFIRHKVEKKQTLFAISRKYNVSQEDIKKCNDELKDGLREGMVLNIPDSAKIKKRQKETEKLLITKQKSSNSNEKQQFIIYTVLQDETLFSICRRYDVNIDDVIRLNPGSENKITAGSELKIPVKTTGSKPKEGKLESAIGNSKTTTVVNKEIEKSNISQQYNTKVIKIGFLLPFMLDQIKKDPGLERFQNFYSGALLAIQQAKQRGISLEIYTYDTEKSEEKVTEVLSNPELTKMDLIIGPAFSNQVNLVANFAKEFKINTLIPFTAIVPDIDTNPYLFQFNPGSDTEMNYLSELITGKLKNMHPVFIDIPGISPIDAGNISAEFIKKQLNKEKKPYSLIELSSPDEINLTGFLKKGVRNLIIFNTDKYANVSPYINSLHSYTSEFDIVLFEQYSWRSQVEKIKQSIYISPFISKFDPEQIKEYDNQFDRYFGKDISSDSPRFDVLGYDLTNYFIALIHRYGNKFGSKINSVNSIKAIQSQPLFERISNESGFINQQVYFGEDNIQQ